MLGGLSNVKDVDENVKKIISSNKIEFEKKNYQTDLFQGDSYKTQIVSGTNYFIKIKTDKEYVHIRIHESLSKDNPELSYHSDQCDKKKDDDIAYFE